MSDVRNHLVAMMESLNEQDVSAEVVARAKATAELAQAYTNTVKVEIDALKMAGKENVLPEVLRPAALTVSGQRE